MTPAPMDADPASGLAAEARLAAWREQGWARLDTVAFVFMEALARRATAQEGEARRRLDARLAALVEAYAARIEKASAAATAAAGDTAPSVNATASGNAASSGSAASSGNASAAGNTAACASASRDGRARTRAAIAPTALASLRDELAAHTAGSKSALPWTTHYPELPLLDEFQQLWSRVSASMRVQESQFQVPDNAGPLNSSHLVHRSLSLMRELAPGYLQHFLAYVDILSWLEPMVVPAIPAREAVKPATKSASKTATGARKPAAKSARKPARSKPADD